MGTRFLVLSICLAAARSKRFVINEALVHCKVINFGRMKLSPDPSLLTKAAAGRETRKESSFVICEDVYVTLH